MVLRVVVRRCSMLFGNACCCEAVCWCLLLFAVFAVRRRVLLFVFGCSALLVRCRCLLLVACCLLEVVCLFVVVVCCSSFVVVVCCLLLVEFD